MAIKRTYIQLQTAAATASFSYLRAPDVGSEYSDNKYKTTILINKADTINVDIINKAVAAAIKAEWPEGAPSNMKSPMRDGAERSDYDSALGDYFMVTFKSKGAPRLYDSKGKPLDPSVEIFSGDVIRVEGAAAAYIASGTKGVTFYLNAVQLIEKKTAATDSKSPFDDFAGGFSNDELPSAAAMMQTAEVSGDTFNF